MFRRYYSLILMGVWLGTAAALLAPDLVVPEPVRGRVRGSGGTMAGLLALMFAAYNLVRWWAGRSLAARAARTPPHPLASRRREDERYEPNPELDFLRVPDADKNDGAKG